MTSAAGAMLSFGALCSIATWVVTYMVMTIRRDRAEDARAEQEFAPILTRWRPAIDVASRLRPVGQAVNAHRVRWSALAAAALTSLPGRVRASLPAVRMPSTEAAPRETLPACPPPRYADRDVNAFTWPTNPAPQPAPAQPVGRVPVELDFNPMDLDFGAWVHGTNARLRHEAARIAGMDATGYIPRVPAEDAVSGGVR